MNNIALIALCFMILILKHSQNIVEKTAKQHSHMVFLKSSTTLKAKFMSFRQSIFIFYTVLFTMTNAAGVGHHAHDLPNHSIWDCLGHCLPPLDHYNQHGHPDMHKTWYTCCSTCVAKHSPHHPPNYGLCDL